mmetsp:Transcript_97243/g.278345  ORF Transcript_97243/g.278345 Transcript_97243/m.278345 type:complete len:264 (+) Transcript_97243:113-904(+)
MPTLKPTLSKENSVGQSGPFRRSSLHRTTDIRESFLAESLIALTPRLSKYLFSADTSVPIVNETSYSCYLWKKSKFYSRAKISSKAWQLKWVTIDKEGFRSCRDRDFPDKHVHVFNIFQGTKVEQIDEKRLVLKLFAPTGNVTFQAGSRKIFDEIFAEINRHLAVYATYSQEDREKKYVAAKRSSKWEDGAEGSHDVVSMPRKSKRATMEVAAAGKRRRTSWAGRASRREMRRMTKTRTRRRRIFWRGPRRPWAFSSTSYSFP